MDNPATLLVSIMFVTIIAIAVGNILMACAEIAGGLRHPLPERIQISWIFLMLFILLSLFWETKSLLDVDRWLFVEFLYVIAGPMVLLFATSVIIAPPREQQTGDSHSQYAELRGRFFIILALHELWLLGLDYWYQSFDAISLINALMLFLFIVLAKSRNMRVHVTGASLIWVGYIISLVLRTLETSGAS